ncbi:MAG: isopenicillin-N epimerase [Bacteroidetes bacterium]|nr:MAG: isopenicillin-N epimerase [Bacteroidota bacterium]
MSNRRSFMKKLGLTAGALSLSSILEPLLAAGLDDALERVDGMTPAEAAADEDFWAYIRECFTVSQNVINLNNGGVSPQPKSVQDAHIRYYQMCNEGPSYFMWRTLDQGREPLRKKLADLAGCSSEEIAINRNSTEGLNTVIFGLNLKAGDEVVLTKQDYPNMINAWKQREKRDGIKLVWLNFEFPIENDEVIVKKFAEAFTDKTKIVHITHIINWTGQILPAKKIAQEAHKRNIEVIADGAHSFAHIDYKIPDLDCDYYATSLHKWLCAPFGSGLLYIKKDKIKNVWALLSNTEPDSSDIRKFESLGTRSFASEMAIAYSVDFHQMIGSKRKEARLRYLKDYWAAKAAKIKGVKLNTSLKAPFSCAIGNFSIEGWKPEEIDGHLFDKYKIHTVGINWENIHGVRVTPHVYTALPDLDKLLEAITEMAQSLPKK